ncbi:MAG: SgcJ/EcaC family oxidoreductase [Flavobacterium sp.]|nr:MAG: SgcJ/EcaC family oxidoreductase [Flavobacterium sp.]
MKKLVLFFLLLLNSYCFAQNSYQEMKKIIDKQESDWNKNDMTSYANSFTEDGKIINFLGFFWKGRNEIINQFRLINECCIKPTQIKLDIIDSRKLNDQTEIVYIKETLTAKEDYNVPGKIVKKGSVDYKMITAVCVERDNIWKVVSMQVTQILPLPKR